MQKLLSSPAVLEDFLEFQVEGLVRLVDRVMRKPAKSVSIYEVGALGESGPGPCPTSAEAF